MRLRILITIVVYAVMNIVSVSAADSNFRMTDKWSHDISTFHFVFKAIVTEEEDVVVMFYKDPISIANKKTHSIFATYGEGPGEIGLAKDICIYKDRIAVIEKHRKTQVFKSTNGKYKWEKNIWREEKGVTHFLRYALFTHGKWFYAGQEWDYVKQPENTYHLLRICDEDGKFIKRLIKIKYPKYGLTHLKSIYLLNDNENIYVIPEEEPTVYIVSIKTLDIVKKVKLEKPDFYVVMPEHFYGAKIKGKQTYAVKDFLLAIQKWKTSYSRITQAAIGGNKFILQVRTCSDKMKKFALLVYNLPSFKLDRVIYTNDLLLSSKNGKYYFFENGNPGYDDEADKFVINIYQFDQ